MDKIRTQKLSNKIYYYNANRKITKSKEPIFNLYDYKLDKQLTKLQEEIYQDEHERT